jgi:hypothetical protein
MSLRRLVPLAVICLALWGLWWGVSWRQGKKEAEKVAAAKVFQVQEAQIGSLTLKRGAEEVRLHREGQDWRLAHPVRERADQAAAGALASSLAGLSFSRDLGAPEDPKTYGLDKPFLVLTFKAGDKTHTLSLGRATPGNTGYYARRDDDPRVLLLAATAVRTLDQPLNALRDRTLLDFSVPQVKSITVKAGKTQVVLEKRGAAWHWQGHDAFKINPDRLERLLRYLSLVRVKEFPSPAPTDLKAVGLAPPALEVTVATDQGEQRLAFGNRHKDSCYAKKGQDGPVVVVEDLLLHLLTAPLETVPSLAKDPLWGGLKGRFPAYLEERRLWTGEVREVASLTFGPPDQPVTAVKDQDFIKITPPGQGEVRKPALTMEMALFKLRDLEVVSLQNPAPPETRAAFSLELKDGQGKPLFRLDEMGKAGDRVQVRFAVGGGAPQGALVAGEAFQALKDSLERLPASPQKKE